MGRHAGFIALNTGIGCGAGGVLIPEKDTTIDSLVKTLRKGVKRNKLFSTVIVAEGCHLGNAYEVAQKVKEAYDIFDTKVTVIGHMQRGGSPSCFDRVLASRLGYAAVEALLEGKRDVMVGLVNNKISYVPFDDAIHKIKSVDEDLLRMAEILAL
jgi:6-phosphofructokinase 1